MFTLMNNTLLNLDNIAFFTVSSRDALYGKIIYCDRHGNKNIIGDFVESHMSCEEFLDKFIMTKLNNISNDFIRLDQTILNVKLLNSINIQYLNGYNIINVCAIYDNTNVSIKSFKQHEIEKAKEYINYISLNYFIK